MDAALTELLLNLRIRFLMRLAGRLGLHPDEAALRDMSNQMSDREILTALKHANRPRHQRIWNFFRRLSPFS